MVHIFISDDSSTDGTGEWIKDYAQHHSNVTFLPLIEPCGGAARNFFNLIRRINMEDFDLIALSDQDDKWHIDKLKRATGRIIKIPSDAYSSNVTAFWPNGKTKLLNKAQPQTQWDYYFEAAGPGCTYVLTNRLAIILQQHIESNWKDLQEVSLHDWYIYAFARSSGYKWYIDPIPSMQYRQHAGNELGANIGTTALISRFKKIRSGWWFGQVRSIESIINRTQLESQRPAWRLITRSDLIYLCFKANRCRRRIRDKVLFQGLCIISAVVGRKPR